MKRKKKVYRRVTPQTELKKSLKRINWKLVIQLLVTFIVLFSVYRTAIYLEFAPIMWIYYVILIALIVLFLILNGGIRREGPDTIKRRIAKKLLIFIAPLLFNFALDIVLLNYFDK
ncbi:MAG: hypothetical protein FWF15_03180 [Oscillospiraceae bacterium]|nr:hypothetical protein [Oscillospiraceae bacterium]